MLLQISSGQGPEECELAVAKLANALCKEFADTAIVQTYPGQRAGCYRSAVLESGQDLSFLDGSIKWICKSPFRLQHKRKNWFVDVSPIKSVGEAELDSEQIVFETFRSSGKGGQHVNKTESGVRATYVPLGLSTISTDERSQHLNKKVATERLQKLVEEHYAEGKRTVERGNWLEHTRLVRGNAIRVYEGLEFRRVE
jgi:peptide chain release factor